MSEERTILALECSAGPASCAVVHFADGKAEVWSQAAVNRAITHSQTLLPLAEGVLKNAELSMADVDTLAIAAGPGSFTGVRIGVAAIKGLAFPSDIPCVGVSTLEAMAYAVAGVPFDGLVMPAMDARCRQIYTATFAVNGGEPQRLTADEALSLEEVGARLLSMRREGLEKPVLLVGDGAELTWKALGTEVDGLTLAPPAWRYQQAVGVALAAYAHRDEQQSAEALQPIYLRLPQAERELRARAAQSAEDNGK